MAFIVPTICRFAHHGTVEDRAWAVIMDMHIDTTGSTMSRDDAVFAQAGILINEWCDHILPFMTDDTSFASVSWVDLNSSTGTTGSRTVTSQETLPQPGGETTETAPGNVAYLVRKTITGDRTHRAGRSYIPGFGFNAVDDNNANIISAAGLIALQDAWTSWFGNVNQEDPGPTTYTSAVAVTHILTRDGDGHPLTGDHRLVTSMSVQQRLATQRRRLRS